MKKTISYKAIMLFLLCIVSIRNYAQWSAAGPNTNTPGSGLGQATNQIWAPNNLDVRGGNIYLNNDRAIVFGRGSDGVGEYIRNSFGLPSPNYGLAFYAGYAERMRILGPNGNVGINTPAPGSRLHINSSNLFGAVNANVTPAPSTTGLRLGITNTTIPIANPTRGVLSLDRDGDVIWVKDSTGGSPTTAAQGVTMVGTQVRLGDSCGAGGSPFLSNREINMSRYNLYFNASDGNSILPANSKIFMGRSTCQPLESRLEISTAGQSNNPLNDYSSPNPSLSGLRFTNLTMDTTPIDNESKGVLSLDHDGDVIWVKRDNNNSNTTNTCGVIDFVPKLTGANTYGCSQIFDNGLSVGIGATSGFGYTSLAGARLGANVPTSSGIVRLEVNGVLRSTASIVTSDGKLKTDVKDLKDALSIVKELKGKTYTWTADAQKLKGIDNGRHAGFIAQELQKVLPELVIQDENKELGVNYIEIIPILTEAVKEVNTKNEDLKSEINDLKTELKELKELILKRDGGSNNESSSAILYQNTPNPFSSTTSIKYYLPRCIGECKIIIADISGKLIHTHLIEKGGEGRFQFDASMMSSVGNLIYTLVADGKVVDSKKMQFTNH